MGENKMATPLPYKVCTCQECRHYSPPTGRYGINFSGGCSKGHNTLEETGCVRDFLPFFSDVKLALEGTYGRDIFVDGERCPCWGLDHLVSCAHYPVFCDMTDDDCFFMGTYTRWDAIIPWGAFE